MQKASPSRQDMEPPKLILSRDTAEKFIDIQIDYGRSIAKLSVRSNDDLASFWNELSTWKEYTYELLRRIFSTQEYADNFIHANNFSVAVGGQPLVETIREAKNDASKYVRYLESIRARLQLIEAMTWMMPEVTQDKQTVMSITNKIFIVHGHDGQAKSEVARVLEKLKLEPIILHEQANQGQTIIEKFEAHSDVGFAIILLTPDDIGGVSKEKMNKRARQNVVLELGYFIGKLGRARVCPLYKDGVELPSDLSGVVYVLMDNFGGWQLQLVKELKAANYKVSSDDL